MIKKNFKIIEESKLSKIDSMDDYLMKQVKGGDDKPCPNLCPSCRDLNCWDYIVPQE